MQRNLQNSILVIHPYRHHGMWVFDDPDAMLVREPFVAGMPEMIDLLVELFGIQDAGGGFNLLFSAAPFHGSQAVLRWTRADLGGNWYALDRVATGEGGGWEAPPARMEGWLCPALYAYFEEAPPALHVRAQPGGGGN